MIFSINYVLKIESGSSGKIPGTYQVHLLDKRKIVRVFNALSLFYTAGNDQIIPLQYPVYGRY